MGTQSTWGQLQVSRPSSNMRFVLLLLLLVQTSLSCGPLVQQLQDLLFPVAGGRDSTADCLMLDKLIQLCPEGRDGFSKDELVECQFSRIGMISPKVDEFEDADENANRILE